jgi:hypothetical protein
MKRRTKVLIGIGCFALLAFGMNLPNLIAAHKQRKSAEAAFNEYCTALVAHDYQRAFSLATEAFQRATPYSIFVEKETLLESEYGQLKSMKIGGIYVHGKGSPLRWTALFESIRNYEKGELRLVSEFHFENGRWLLFGYKRL